MKQYSLHIGAPSHSAVLFTIDDKKYLIREPIQLPGTQFSLKVTTICLNEKWKPISQKNVETHIHTKSLKADN